MGKHLLIIGLGGFLGSVSRYLTGFLVQKNWPSISVLGTFTANVVGCLLIGAIYGLYLRYEGFTNDWRLFLITGFCGGYTTFSTFAFENAQMLQTGAYKPFIYYTIGSLTLGIIAVFGGLLLTK